MKKKIKPKKVKVIEVKEVETPIEIPIETPKAGIGKIDVDYSNEGLNGMARKINEIIDYLNAL